MLINTILIDRIAVPVPTFGEYIEKLKDQRDAELFLLSPEEDYNSIWRSICAWVHRRRLEGRCSSSIPVIRPASCFRSMR